jgi:TetR/AcrR family transcriptional regulator, transcriptional repressor for nem operon
MSVERAMAGAGLTVGAFYAHFAGKAELLEESFTLALDELGAVMMKSAAGRTGRAALLDVAADYLSETHRDHSKRGCPMPAVTASTIPLGGRSLHHLVARGLETLAGRLFTLGAGDIANERSLALAVLMVGGQIVARATRGSPMSSKVLAASREAAKALLLPRS